MELKDALVNLFSKKSSNSIEPSHVAWVPCVSGHLDFGLMKVGLDGSQDRKGERDDPHYTLNYASEGSKGGHQRNILLESWVDWKDSDAGDGVFRVILIAKANKSRSLDGRSLEGQIFLYPKAYEKGGLKNITSPLLQEIRHLHKTLHSSEENGISWREKQEYLNTNFDKIHDGVNVSAPLGFPDNLDNDTPVQHQYVIDFRVAHNGITFLELKDKTHPKAFPITEEIRYTVIRQAFYYIKYGLHTHKHHEFERDALTTVIPILPEIAGPSKTIGSIWLQLIGQLKRELVRIKRTQSIAENDLHVNDIHTAEGIIAYSRTLLSQLKYHEFLKEGCYSRELESLNGVKASLSAHAKGAFEATKVKERKQDVERHWGTFFIAFFGALGVGVANFANIYWSKTSEINQVVVFTIFCCVLFTVVIGVRLAKSWYKQVTSEAGYVEKLIKEKGFFNTKSVMKKLKWLFTVVAITALIQGFYDIALLHLPLDWKTTLGDIKISDLIQSKFFLGADNNTPQG
ncbi:MAG: hypothetical protein HRU04_05645 [Oceanospirillaceae bacterium]|nr:hypothetical protein [Oceanospirillaceae bacterium]